MNYYQSLSAAGFVATAISFGPARMGFGLFVPEFRDAFSMSTSTVGYVASLGFLGFFLGLLAAQVLLERRGPEAPVLAGLVAATLGIGMVAAAQGVILLAAGVFLAATSAGFAWTPFNDAVHRKIEGPARAEALSRISTGTAIGIAVAGLSAVAMVIAGFSWRACWVAFAVASLFAIVGNRVALHPVERAPVEIDPDRWRPIAALRALPLYLIGFVFGVTSAIYISFAADYLRGAGGVPGLPPAATPGLLFVVYGLVGLTGVLTGRAKSLLGLKWLVRTLMLAGTVSLASLPLLGASWTGLILSAGLQGLHVMMTSAVLAFWSEELFPALPSLGFTATLLATAAGSVLGPAVAGLVSDGFGAETMFLATAGLSALAALAFRARHAQEQPVAPA